MIFERMHAEYQRLDEKIKTLTAQLEQLPKGNFYCVRNGKYAKWYFNDGKQKIYIPQKNRSDAEVLAIQKYLSLQLEDCVREQKAIEFYIRHHISDTGKAEKLLQNPEYIQLLSPYFKPTSQKHLDWMASPYEKNPKYPEQLTQKTASGNFVRSKSEVLIDLALYTNKIPFRYECALHLNHTILYPDFTILHPVTGKIYYWEHFGMMDNPNYSRNACSKLQIYTSHGIIPSINLITTYETTDHPLTLEIIEKIIEHYFM